ncbi:cell division protein ZipA C-terminal FtsZ-binding domain-containing protein [Vreelandella nigrificans]|uniref:Cell division protein ZipA n=1 Tax=Vreelandella nigrificans TaxID=2042704 RepID=A0A2A4HQE2_9GAMM|nr:cell division protein ZipA C-terminal FtsZ-binding domain-containing protein [Halomonas nigrificans]PCF97000.1 cell division protein ZipA [Halomonas nigrificans]
MELREWLIILGLALVSLIVVDGVRRLQRQRRVPRLDQAVKDLPAAKPEEFDDAAKEAEINWELPNGGARVVKPADYSGLGRKPKLERQEHPGPSKVLADFRRSFSRAMPKHKSVAKQKSAVRQDASIAPLAQASVMYSDADMLATTPAAQSEQNSPKAFEQERQDPSVSVASVSTSDTPTATSNSNDIANDEVASTEPKQEALQQEALQQEKVSTPIAEQVTAVEEPIAAEQPIAAESSAPETAQSPVGKPTPTVSDHQEDERAEEESASAAAASQQKKALDETQTESASTPLSAVDETSLDVPTTQQSAADQDEPVLRAEPEDAAFAKHSSDAPKRRQLRLGTAGEYSELGDDEIDEYRLVDFEGIARSFKRRLIERRKQKAIKKAEKAKRAEALAKQKAERKALEAEQRREAKEAAAAEKARLAQERAEAREAAAKAAEAQRIAQEEARAAAAAEAMSQSAMSQSAMSQSDRSHSVMATDGYKEPSLGAAGYADDYSQGYDSQGYDSVDEYDEYVTEAYASQDSVVRNHPTLEKALRHDVNGEHAKETLTNADEMVVISVLSRDPEGFDGGKLLELMMVCGLRYSRTMGIFHRFETESSDSELQFSMVNVLKPGTFPIEEMDDFVTPGITLLMPLPGAADSSAAFEAMVETAMVLVRHMGGELKDENHSVMTAQTIEFSRQRVHEFERRNRLHRHMQAR